MDSYAASIVCGIDVGDVSAHDVQSVCLREVCSRLGKAVSYRALASDTLARDGALGDFNWKELQDNISALMNCAIHITSILHMALQANKKTWYHFFKCHPTAKSDGDAKKTMRNASVCRSNQVSSMAVGMRVAYLRDERE